MAEEITDITVIAPVYGVEAYIERFTRSLMEQTLQKGVEVIFVDDATPDKSIEILRRVVAEYPERKVTIVSHPKNMGLPAARNTGLSMARGEYVMHADSDDYLEPDALEKMLESARENDADMVWSDWWLDFGKKRRYMKQPEATDGKEAARMMLAGAMKYNVWNKLVRRSLYEKHGIVFPAGQNMGEDMTMILLASESGKTAHVATACYHYMKLNSGALTADYNNQRLAELRSNVERTENYLLKRFGEEYTTELQLLRLQVKYAFLFFTDMRRGYELWCKWYPESNNRIGKNRYEGKRATMIQRWAASGQTIRLRLYRFLLLKIYYRLF